MGEHQDDVEADFLVFYRIPDPWSLPPDRFMALARRLFFYQGTLQYRAMEEQERQEGGSRTTSSAPSLTSGGVDMRHNMAAAKAAAKGAKLKEGDDEVKVIPLTSWMAQFPGLGERQEV